MKRFITSIITALTLLLLAQCSPKTAETTTATRHPAPTNTGGNTRAPEQDMKMGMQVFQDNCGRCHKLFVPESRTVNQWNHILPEMIHKAKLDETNGNMVRAYVLSNAKKG